MKLDQTSLSPTFSSDPDIKSEEDLIHDYIIEFSGIDGNGHNGLQGIFITVAQESDINDPLLYGVIIYDPAVGIVPLDQLTDEEIYTYLGRMTYNGHSEFFFDRTEMTLRLISSHERDSLVQQLLPTASQEEIETISDELALDLFSMNDAFGMAGLNNAPGWDVIKELAKKIVEIQNKNPNPVVRALQKEFNDIVFGRAPLPLKDRWILFKYEKLPGIRIILTRLGLIGLAAGVGAGTGYCIFINFIEPNMREPRIPSVDDLPPGDIRCAARRSVCENYWHPDGPFISRDPNTGLDIRGEPFPPEIVNAMRERCAQAELACLNSHIDDLLDEAQEMFQRQEIERLIGLCPVVVY